MKRIDNLLRAIETLLLSEDNEGCTEDLTVVSSDAIQNLRKEYDIIKKQS